MRGRQPSIVAFSDDGRAPGRPNPPKRQAVDPIPSGPSSQVKRLVGRRYDDPMVEKDKKLVPYKIVKASNGRCPGSRPTAKNLTRPRRFSAFILQKMKRDRRSPISAQKVSRQAVHHRSRPTSMMAQRQGHQGRRPRSLASKCCASSTSRQRQRLLTGWTRRKSGTHRGVRPRRAAATFDHFQFSRSGDGRFRGQVDQRRHLPRRRRLRTCGWSNYLADEFQKEQGINPAQNDKACPAASERGFPKRPRSNCPRPTQTEINLPFITADQAGPKHLTMKLTPLQVSKALVDDLVQKTHRAVPQGAEGMRGLTAAEIGRSGCWFGGHDAHAEGFRKVVKQFVRQGAAQGRQPG